jgi:hypothetical protein
MEPGIIVMNSKTVIFTALLLGLLPGLSAAAKIDPDDLAQLSQGNAYGKTDKDKGCLWFTCADPTENWLPVTNENALNHVPGAQELLDQHTNKDFEQQALHLAEVSQGKAGESPSPIPLPAAVWLMLSGLGSLLLLGRRRGN